MLRHALAAILVTIALVSAAACWGDEKTAPVSPPPPATRIATADTPPPQTHASPPAGGIVFSIAGALWRVNVDGSGLRRLAGASGAPLPGASAPAIGQPEAGAPFAILPALDAIDIKKRIELFDKFPLTPTGADNWDIGPFAVHWSPDAALLLVTRQRAHGGSGHTDVMLMKPDGSERRTFLSAEQLAPSFPEATWSASHAPDPRPPPSIVVVGGANGTTGEAYDLRGNRLPAVYPAQTTRIAVAMHQNPAGEGGLVASSAGSPEPFGPIELYDITGASRVVGRGCGAAWSPDGRFIAYYNGSNITVQPLYAETGDPDRSPRRIVSNADVGLDASRAHPELCLGAGITWRREPFIDSPD